MLSRSSSVLQPVNQSRPEHTLLLHCARTQMDPARAQTVRELVAQGLDWDYLIKIAQRHGVMQLLYQNLSVVCPDSVPAAVLAQLKQLFLANAQSNLFHTGELFKLIEQFNEAGVKAMPYKGPALAVAGYRNLALRQFCDLDILIPREQVPAAWKELITMGYEPLEDLSPAQEKFCRRYAYAYGFRHLQSDVLVELHWEILPRWFSVPFDTEGVWDRSRPMQLAGRAVSTPCPEDMLLMLCLHGAKEAWKSLGWICDLNELLQNNEIQWDSVVRAAKRSKCEALLGLGLLLAKSLLGTPLPADICEKANSDSAVSALAARLQQQLLAMDVAAEPAAATASVNLSSRGSALERTRCWLSMALVPSLYDISWVRLPKPLFPLYYLVRPVRLIAKYGFNLAGRNSTMQPKQDSPPASVPVP